MAATFHSTRTAGEGSHPRETRGRAQQGGGEEKEEERNSLGDLVKVLGGLKGNSVELASSVDEVLAKMKGLPDLVGALLHSIPGGSKVGRPLDVGRLVKAPGWVSIGRTAAVEGRKRGAGRDVFLEKGAVGTGEAVGGGSQVIAARGISAQLVYGFFEVAIALSARDHITANGSEQESKKSSSSNNQPPPPPTKTAYVESKGGHLSEARACRRRTRFSESGVPVPTAQTSWLSLSFFSIAVCSHDRHRHRSTPGWLLSMRGGRGDLA